MRVLKDLPVIEDLEDQPFLGLTVGQGFLEMMENKGRMDLEEPMVVEDCLE